jgi:hypothetical protein
MVIGEYARVFPDCRQEAFVGFPNNCKSMQKKRVRSKIIPSCHLALRIKTTIFAAHFLTINQNRDQ